MKATSSVVEISRPIRQECTPVTTPPTKATSSSVQILTTERTPYQAGDGLREVKIHSRSAEVLTQSPKHRVFPVVSGSKDLADNRSVGSGPSSVSSDGSRTPAQSDMSETSSAGSTPRGSPKKTVKIPVARPTFTSYGGYDATNMLKGTKKNGNGGSDVKTDRENFRRKLEALNGSHVDSTKRRFELAQKRASAPLSSSLQSSREHSPSHSIDSDSSDRGRHTDSELSTRSPAKDSDIAAMFHSLRDGKVSGKATIVTLQGGGKWSPPKGGSPRKDDKGQSIRYPPPPAGFMTPKQISEASKRGMEPIPVMRTPPTSGRPFSAPINPQQLASYRDEHLSILPGQLPITKSRMQESHYANLPISPARMAALAAASTAPAATTTTTTTATTSPAQSPNKKQKDSPRSLRSSFFSSDRSKASSQSKSSTQPKSAQGKKATAKSQGGSNNNNNQDVPLTQEQELEQQRKQLQQKQQPLLHEMQQKLQKRRSLVEEQMKQEEEQQQQQHQQEGIRQQTQQSVPQQHTTTTVTKKETTIQATKVAVLIPTDPIPPVPQQRQPPQTQAKQQKQPPAVSQKPTIQKRPLSQPQATSQVGGVKKQQPPVPPAKPPRQGGTTSASSTQPTQTLSQTHKPPGKSSPWSVSPSVPLPQHQQQQRSERPLSGHYKTNTLGSNSSGSRNSSGASTPSPESEKKDGGREKPLDRAVRERTIPTNGTTKDTKGEKRAPKISFDEMVSGFRDKGAGKVYVRSVLLEH